MRGYYLMCKKQNDSEYLFAVIAFRHGADRTLMVDGGGNVCGASKPGDKQLGCEESEE
jgi:hypothetical protein